MDCTAHKTSTIFLKLRKVSHEKIMLSPVSPPPDERRGGHQMEGGRANRIFTNVRAATPRRPGSSPRQTHELALLNYNQLKVAICMHGVS